MMPRVQILRGLVSALTLWGVVLGDEPKGLYRSRCGCVRVCGLGEQGLNVGISAWVEKELVILALVKMGFVLTGPVCCLFSRGKCNGLVLAFLWDWPASDTWLS